MKIFDILVISDDVVGEKMAGPGIRAWELSKCLTKDFNVVLAIPDYSHTDTKSLFFERESIEILRYSVQKPESLIEIAGKSRIIITQGYILSKFPSLLLLDAYIIADIYVPFVLENLFVHKWKIESLKDREFTHLHDLKVFNEQILKCDHFLCANPRQKDLFLGSMMTLNRVNPDILDCTPTLEDLISIVPFGLSEEEEEEERDSLNVLKTQFPKIKDNNIIFLWGGVLSNWFDPIILIRAFSEALSENPNIKLVFMSTKHANPLLPEFDMVKKAIQISDDFNLTDKHIFFNHEWVNYGQRKAFYSEADVGLSISPRHFENDYAFRTRMLDYIKNNLPILCTRGDHFAEIVEKENLGITIEPENQEELRAAIIELAENKKLREVFSQRSQEIKKTFTWDYVTRPLIKHCQKVLSGEIKKKKIPNQKDLQFLISDKKESVIKKFAKRYFWMFFQKLHLRLAVKLKRLLKS